MPVTATGGGNWELARLCEIGLSEPAPVWRTEGTYTEATDAADVIGVIAHSPNATGFGPPCESK